MNTSIMTEERDEGLIAAMEALQAIKDLNKNGKFKKLPFMKHQLFQEFHRVLTQYKNTGELDEMAIWYFRYWVQYFDLSRDEFRDVVFTKSLSYEHELAM